MIVAMELSPAQRLFSDGPAFDFFQAVRLLERLTPDRRPVGRDFAPSNEVVRFRAHLSLAFPPSSIHEIQAPVEDRPHTRMIQTFMGLTGPSGVLPRHYTQILLDLGRDVRGPERRSLGDWFALFDHRWVSLFYRAWEKYRFYVAYERGEAEAAEPDTFTSCLFSLVGLGLRSVRHRQFIAMRPPDEESPPEVLARIPDLALLHYAGFLAQRPRNAVNLRAMLEDYFEVPVEVCQFQGEWLPLERPDLTCLGIHGTLGIDSIAGDRVWSIQSKIRIRVGPVCRGRFERFLPDRAASAERKSLFLVSQLVRLYLGPELDFDVQMVLKAEEVPDCQLSDGGFGPRLGWNTWLQTLPRSDDASDAVFPSEESVWLD